MMCIHGTTSDDCKRCARRALLPKEISFIKTRVSSLFIEHTRKDAIVQNIALSYRVSEK